MEKVKSEKKKYNLYDQHTTVDAVIAHSLRSTVIPACFPWPGATMSTPLFYEDRDGINSEDEKTAHQLNEHNLNDNRAEKSGQENNQIDAADVRIAQVSNTTTSPQNVDLSPHGADIPGNAVWEDEDDVHHNVDISSVRRRRKLRRQIGETHVPGTVYSRRIREMYTARLVAGARGTGAWAQLPSEKKRKNREGEARGGSLHESDDDSDNEGEKTGDVQKLLQSTAKFVTRRRQKRGSNTVYEQKPLRADVLDIHPVANANGEDPNQAEARCVEFHPSGQLLLTAGLDKTLRIFQVDGERNAKVQGIHIKAYPIHTAKFTGAGTQVIMAGRRRFFYQLDMNSGIVSPVHTLSSHEERSWERFEVSADGSMLAFLGQEGKIVIVSNSTKREIGQLRLNGRVAAVSFASDRDNPHHVYASSIDGTVYLWDSRKMACVDRHKDEGAIHSTCLATSPKHYALGSDSGVVNIYSLSAMGPSSKASFGIRTEKPDKSFLNLTTPIHQVAFNHDGNLMAFSSHDKKNSIRVAHVPSMTVYSNWPSPRANVRRVCCLRFSPNGGYFAVGNDRGDVQLLRLSSYATA